MPVQIGQNLGPYRITNQLGQGGMATVYKAYHASLDRYVAVKLLHQALREDESFALRFKREAQIVAKLEHPNIVPIYDFAADDTEPYIVMKFIEGTTLKHRLQQDPLSLDETKRILAAIAAALSYAHKRGILHRDIKPSNVMLDEESIPYLADFGLARMVTSGESTMSQDVLIGTPNYISPEQAKGIRDLEPATDIYSLGIMLYEIVVGRVPYTADTPFAVVHDHIYKPLPLPTQVNPTVPIEVEKVLLRALAKSPRDRYQNAQEMISDFEAALKKANMTELSAASLRLEAFQDETFSLEDKAATQPPSLESPAPAKDANSTATPSDMDINNAIRVAVAEQLKSAQMTPTSAGVPAVTSTSGQSFTPPPYYYSQRGPMAYRGFWMVSGVAALVFICIAILAVSLNAANNPVIQDNPALAEGYPAPPNAPPRGDGINFNSEDLNLSLEDATVMLGDHPQDPGLLMLISLRHLEQGDVELAAQFVARAVNSPQADARVFAEAANVISQRGFGEDAVLLWLIAYHLEPEDPDIRARAGEFLYRQYVNNELSIRDISEFTQSDIGIAVDEQGDVIEAPLEVDSPFSRTMIAHAMISVRPRTNILLQRAEALLMSALEQDDSLAETHLILGNYYEAEDEVEDARESWRFAASFQDAPQWVQNEALRQLRATDDGTSNRPRPDNDAPPTRRPPANE